MAERLEFREKLAGILTLCESQNNITDKATVEAYFAEDNLSAEQMELVFDYLLSIRAFGDLNKNTSRLIDIVSDIMKFEKFDYFKYLERYYIIHADSLEDFKDKIDSYPTLRGAYSNEAYDWLTETIKQISTDDYTIR